MSCVQKIGTTYLQSVEYGCNSVTIKVQGVTHSLGYLLSYSENSAIVSNNISTFELYVPGVDIDKLKECFNCSQKVTLDNILGGVGSIINSFNNNNNTNSNNSNSTVGNSNSLNSCCTESTLSDWEKKEIQRKEIEVKEQLDRIEREVQVRNYGEQSFLPFVIIICLVLVVVILIIAKNL